MQCESNHRYLKHVPWCGAMFPRLIAISCPLLICCQVPGQVGSVVRHDGRNSDSSEAIVQPIYYPLNPRRPAGAAVSTDLPEDVMRQFLEYHSALRFDLAADAALRLVELVPDRPLPHYNLACAFAQLRRPEHAFQALDQAIECGWRNVHHTLLDPDLRSLRQDDRFVQCIARMRRLLHAEQIIPRPLRTDSADAIRQEIRAGAETIMGKYHVPGISVVFIDCGKAAWTETFGLADASSGAPLKPDVRFRIDGARDLFALVAALQQESSGTLQLASLLEHRRQLLAIQKPRADSPEMRPASGSVRIVDPAQPSRSWMLGDLADSRSLFETMVAVATDMDFDVYCKRHILVPLQLQQIQCNDGNTLATGHSVFGTPAQPSTINTNGFAATAEELARLIGAMMATENESSTVGVRLVSVRSLGEQVTTLGTSLGLGVSVERSRYGTRVHMLDQGEGVGCLVRAFPEAGRGVVVFFNSETGGPCAERIAHAALGGM